MLTLVLGVGFAVVGIAGAASAHHNTISGTVACKTGGGWAVTWRVVNSEARTETITASNRSAVVPVGTPLTSRQTRTFTETVTTKPTSTQTLTLSARWDNGSTNTSSGSIPVEKFEDGCNVTTVEPPTIPVVDDCGPGNAHYGQVPPGPWSAVTNPDGSVTVTTTAGTQFPGGATTVTFPAPVDSNQPCPTPVVTPPVVTPPEVLPAEARVVSARARMIDKCGTRGDVFKVHKRTGVVYTSKGKVLRQGAWLKATSPRVTVRAHAADATFRLQGKQVWKMTFRTRPCASAPEVAPNTGHR
ncbi:hypothetical protein [Nocardioides sp. zg-1228]|uniref:hypothetical protein n=1 Tax=Nocardioides sp. zg-1228 TaxID=2763008 RepID=UPI0016431389|nr:hypothetical protein [Nocardioides sp. zg-1228]MBC2935006.1 hypothetical protein [Nocardioides sp. zg-1228]QSF56178.1 hypothetical protein JX575_10865 [Nocardioides sp. zg-1228]